MFIADDLAMYLTVAAVMGYKKYKDNKRRKKQLEDSKSNLDKLLHDSSKDSYSLFVFGYTGAGKSTFLEKLGANVNTAGYGTAEEKYPSFTTKVGEKIVSIKEGIDIGGDKRYLQNGTIEKMLKEKDKVIFVFAATSFLDKRNKHYRGEIMSRLEALYNVPNHRSKVTIIASRLDECNGDRQIVINDIKREFVDKHYRDILNDSFGVFNLTNEKDIELIKQMIFNK